MVTIEQKLTLFSKLLNQDIKEEMDEKFAQLEKEFEKKIAENKFAVDKEATEIVEQARRRAETKKVELISKGRLSSKKEAMQVKREVIERFLKALEEKVVNFTKTPEYLKYLSYTISELKELAEGQNNLEVYLTQNDYDNHRSEIEKALNAIGIKSERLTFKVSETPILGGLVVVDEISSTRIDGSMSQIIEDAKEHIIEKISKAIGEVGEEINE